MPSPATFTNLELTEALRVADYVDDSANSGARTVNRSRGRNAFAAGASTVVITNSKVTATSLVVVNLEAADGALTSVLRTAVAAGSFTVTANAASTGAAGVFSWLVVN